MSGIGPIPDRRTATEAGRVARRRPAASAQGPVTSVLRLQRSAGNAAVSRYLQRDGDAGTPVVNRPPVPPATVPPRKDYVFLMGDTKRDNFYIAADAFFAQHEKGAEIVRDKKTLADVIAHVNAGAAPALRIIIVSHANEAGNLGFSLDAADLAKDKSAGDQKPRTEFKELRDANAVGTLPAADVAKIDSSTRVDIKGCNIGRSTLMLNALDRAFGGSVTVTAPTHKQEYSLHSAGKGKPMVTEDALFQYSIEDPGHPTLNAADRAARFKAKYSDVPAAAWSGLLKAAKEHHQKKEEFVWKSPNPPHDDAAAVFARIGTAKLFPKNKGWTVAYKGRTVAGNNYQFEIQADRVTSKGSETQTRSIQTPIPPDGETLKAQQIADSGRPGAYLWTVEDKIEGGTLIRTVFSERTEWVIDQKVIDKSGVAHPPIGDTTFYGTSTFTPPPPPAP